MPPKRSILTSPDTVLKNLARGMIDRLAEVRAVLAAASPYGSGRDPAGPEGNKAFYWIVRDGLLAGWHRYDLPELAGKELTNSERVRWRQECRKMEADGLVEIAGDGRANEIAFTEKGVERLQQLPGGPELVEELAKALGWDK